MIDNRESIDPAAQKLIKLANEKDIETIFDRVKKQQPSAVSVYPVYVAGYVSWDLAG